MKKIIIIILLIIVGYMIYNRFFATPNNKISNDGLTAQDFSARQLEAQDLLRLAYQRQESYYNRHGKYTYKFEDLDITPRGTFYTLRVLDVKPGYFEIKAEGNIDNDPTIDVWMININGVPINLVNDAQK